MLISFEFWLIFSFLVIILFSIDVYATDHRKGNISLKASIIWSIIWIITGLSFAVLIYYFFPNGGKKSIDFLTAYIVEKSLSVDNLFVFIMIFSLMNIHTKDQPHILKWGIIGAIILRILFILLGIDLINRFHFMIYIFGIIIVYTAIKIIVAHDKKVRPEKNVFVRFAKRIYPVKTDIETHKFFYKDKITHKRYITMPFITLLLVESTDIIFAVDSIPAVLAITPDPFIAITSNIFAILGLRALYFALAGVINLFRYLKYGIAIILLFIGAKMIFVDVFHIDTAISLLIVVSVLTLSILASFVIKEKH